MAGGYAYGSHYVGQSAGIGPHAEYTEALTHNQPKVCYCESWISHLTVRELYIMFVI